MPYFPVDDQASFHPKIVAAGNAAVGLWTRAGAWCKNHATGGMIPEAIARSMGTKTEIRKLTEVGLWDQVLGGYLFHDWEHYGANRNGAEEEAARDARRAADRERQRRKRDRDRDSHAVSHAVTPETVTEGVSRARSRALAQGPVPSPGLPTDGQKSSVPQTGGEARTDEVSPHQHYIEAGIKSKVDFRKIRARAVEQAPDADPSDALLWGITTEVLGRAKPRGGDRTGVVLASIERDWATDWAPRIYRQEETA